MDTLHDELFAGLEQLAQCSDTAFRYAFSALVQQVERAFFLEESWMENIDFAGTLLHQEQHARVLGALHHVHARVMHGDLAVGRDVVERLLPQWLSFHMETMDTALAIALQTADWNGLQESSSQALRHPAPAAIH